MIKSILFYFTIIIFTLPYFVLFSVIWVLMLPFDRNRRVIHEMSRVWSKTILGVAPGWKVEVEGVEKVDPHQAYTVISNHQSMLDIPLLYVLPINFKWVSKREVYKMPLFGWVLRMHGDVAIERGGVASTKKMIVACNDYLHRGVSVNIFPEGTRTKTGRVGLFKEGAFVVAKESKTPILQVVHEGTGRAVLPHSFRIRSPHVFRVKILDVIDCEQVATLSGRELAELCHQRAVEEHRKMRPEIYND